MARMRTWLANDLHGRLARPAGPPIELVFAQFFAQIFAQIFALVMAAAMQPAIAQSTQAAGYLDALSDSFASGWACIPAAETPANVAIYAGAHRIGIYPPSIARPDTAGVCGAAAGTDGFKIDLTPIVAQQFLYQSNLTFFALAQGAFPYLLPSSDPSLTDPAQLPTGLLTSLSPAGLLSGIVTNTNSQSPAPGIDVYAGGPAASGGEFIGQAGLTQVQPGFAAQGFAEPLPAGTLANLPPGYLPSIYATGSYAGGPASQLGSPAMPGAGFTSLYANLMQTGAVSGITSTIYTHWVGGNYAFMGLTGSVSLVGNDPSFSEALVTVGFTGDSQLACLRKNATSPSVVPPFSRLAAVIMKSNDTIGDVLPVSITLPYGVPMAGPKGTCLLLWISAGYPFLSPYAAKYANTNSRLAAMLAPPPPNAPFTVAEGLGNEFRFPAGSTAGQYTVVSMRLNTKVQLDAIAGSVSAGGIAGAPASTNLVPPPAGNWIATTFFYAFNQGGCSALGLTYGPGNPYFAVARTNLPAAFSIPSDARLLLTVPLFGLAGIVTEQSFFQTIANPQTPAALPFILQPGECLIAFHNVAAPAGSLDGVLDLENQSTAYFHLVK
jgi:hypothetical protein